MEREIYALILIFVSINISGAINVPRHKNTVNKCCPLGTYVGPRKLCYNFNRTYSFSTLKVYDENYYEIDATFDEALTLKFGNLSDEFFENSVDVSIDVLDFNLYIMQVSIVIIEKLSFCQP